MAFIVIVVADIGIALAILESATARRISMVY